jgi:hypothetical protein
MRRSGTRGPWSRALPPAAVGVVLGLADDADDLGGGLAPGVLAGDLVAEEQPLPARVAERLGEAPPRARADVAGEQDLADLVTVGRVGAGQLAPDLGGVDRHAFGPQEAGELAHEVLERARGCRRPGPRGRVVVEPVLVI